MKFCYGVNPGEKREKLLKSKVAERKITELIISANKAVSEEIGVLKMSDYIRYSEDGDRSVFENQYFSRRRNCTDIFMAYWITEDEKYLKPLIDYIGSICDEFTWCVPAHCPFPGHTIKTAVEHVDLFQAETARMFAEIEMCVGDKLPLWLRERMKYEIHRRIFPTVLNEEKYWWEDCKMNWAVVCASGCIMAAMYFGDETQKEYMINRFMPCLDNYLSGIEDDGCCLEGMAYWNYGFEHFVIQAQIVKEYTDGKMDYFSNPKVKQIALFPQKIRMSNKTIASISDGGETFEIKMGLISYLKEIYPEVILPDLKYCVRCGNIDSVCEFLWFDENYKSDSVSIENSYFPNSQWYVSRKQKFSFVAKGGHNDEAHNHNDVGSFMITVGDETFISDLGQGVYNKDTFFEKRYTFLNNCSRGHSVPVINGEYQMPGREYCAKNVKISDNSFELDIEDAYKKGTINKINRRFDISDDKIKLTDTFNYSGETISIKERFISKMEPVLCDGFVDFGAGKICYDKTKYTPKFSSEMFRGPNHNPKDIMVYITDFIPVLNNEKVFEFEITF